jgi:hypothetical protein
MFRRNYFSQVNGQACEVDEQVQNGPRSMAGTERNRRNFLLTKSQAYRKMRSMPPMRDIRAGGFAERLAH